MSDDLILVRVNTPEAAIAISIAGQAVADRLAACANIEPEIHSIFHWKGELQEAVEVPVLLKTQAKHFDALVDLITRVHPDDTPAILALPIQHTTARFAAWIKAETS